MIKLIDFLAKHGTLVNENAVGNIITCSYTISNKVLVTLKFLDAKIIECNVAFKGSHSYTMKASEEELDDYITISFIKECCFDEKQHIGSSLLIEPDHIIPITDCSTDLFKAVRYHDLTHAQLNYSIMKGE